MSDLFWLTLAKLERIEPYFPLSHGIPCVGDRRVISGIIHVLKRGLQWKDAPAAYGSHKTLYNRFKRWSELGVFDRIFTSLVSEDGPPDQLQVDSSHPKAHRTAASLAKMGDVSRDIGRTKGGLNSKLHAACDGRARPVWLHLSSGKSAITKVRGRFSITCPAQSTCWRTGVMMPTGSARGRMPPP